MVLIGGAALAVALPMTALAAVPDDECVFTDDPITAEEARIINWHQHRTRTADPAQVADPAQIGDQLQVRTEAAVRQQLRVHVDTDPPADGEAVQTRQREREQLATGNPDAPMGDVDAPRGNPDAPMLGDGSGDCIMDGDQVGDGPNGPEARNKG
jgi:hypothetical protein